MIGVIAAMAILMPPAALLRESAPTPVSLLDDVCLPFVNSSGDALAAAAGMGLTGSITAERSELQTDNGTYQVRLSSVRDDAGAVESLDCVVQLRTWDRSDVVRAIRGRLDRVGYVVLDTGSATSSTWVRGDWSVTVSQNPGRSTILKVGYSAP